MLRRVVVLACVSLLSCGLEPSDPVATKREALGVPSRVRSLRGAAQPEASSYPAMSRFPSADLNGATLFLANDTLNGIELWRTDGTDAGTYLVRDVSPGPASGVQSTTLVAADGYAWFIGSDGARNAGLWRTDGTTEGTQFVSGFSPAASNSALVSTGDGAWFYNGAQFIRADATGARAMTTGTTYATQVTSMGGKVYFIAFAQTGGGYALWRVDPAFDAGTTQVGNLCSQCPSALQLLSSTDTVYTVTNSSVFWSSSGTAPSMNRVQFASPYAGIISTATKGSELYFTILNSSAGAELWRSDGTDAGTRPIRWLNRTNPIIANNLTASGDGMFFWSSDSVTGVELWRSDGTDGGTYVMADIGSPNASNGTGAIVPWAGGVITTMTSTQFGEEPWIASSDAGPFVVDVAPGASDSFPRGYFAGGNGAYFWANDSDLELHRVELDGGFRRVGNLNPRREGIGPTQVLPVGNRLFFAWNDGTRGSELWSSTALDASVTNDLIPGSIGSAPSQLVALGDTVYFLATTPQTGLEIFKSDGTDAGTMVAFELVPDAGSSGFLPVGGINGRLVVVRAGGALYAFAPDAGLSAIGNSDGGLVEAAVQAGGELYFFLENAFSGSRQLWRTDGTSAGTAQVTSSTASMRSWLTEANGTVYYSGAPLADPNDIELYAVIDGGARQVADLFTYVGSGSRPEWLASAGGRVWFVAASTPTQARDLWSSDGTDGGTRKALSLGGFGPNATNLTGWGNLLLFQWDNGTGRRYWALDTTDGGLSAVTDAPPTLDPNVATALRFTVSPQGAFFPAGDSSGNELWTWQGPGSTAFRVGDFNRGPSSSNPSFITVAGENLFLVAEEADAPALHVLSLVGTGLDAGGGTGGGAGGGGGTATGGGAGGGSATGGGAGGGSATGGGAGGGSATGGGAGGGSATGGGSGGGSATGGGTGGGIATGGGAGGGTGGGSETGGGAGGGAATGGGGGSATGGGTATGGGAGGGSASGGGEGGGSATGGGGSDGDPTGCGCTTDGSVAPLLGFALLAFVRRRARL